MSLRASFLIALREDALAKIDRFKATIPGLFANYLRLEHLDRDAAREAIVGPVTRYNELDGEDPPVAIEPALVEAVLDQVAAGKVALGDSGQGAVAYADEGAHTRIETPFLQLVMERLWDAEHEAGSRTLRRATLDELGGAEQIVRTHLDRALATLTPDQRDLASSIFNQLVTPSGTKIAHADPDLARYAGVDGDELQPVLARLVRERILRPVAPNGGVPRYEIYHDVLGTAVLAWRNGHEAEREVEHERQASHRRHRRLLGVIVVGGFLLAAMAGVTAFAFSQRSEAQTQARLAQARQLTASAVSALASDPSLSLSLASEAARLDPTEETEATLRGAYLADRRRAVLPAGGAVSSARFSSDGKLVVIASADGSARIYDAVTHRLRSELDHGARVADAAFDGSGHSVLTAGADGIARLWSVEGTPLRTFRHGPPIRAAAIDPAGVRVATAGGRSVTLWRVDGTEVANLRSDKPVKRVSFNPDGSRLVVVSNDRVARMYDAVDGRLVATFDQGAVVTSATFSNGPRLLVTTGVNDTARIWRLRDGALLHELKGHRGTVVDAAFSPGGSRVATASADGTGRIWDVRSGALVASLVGHAGIVRAVAFSPDGNFVVTGSDDRTARVSKADNGDARAWLAGHDDSVRSVTFSPDGSAVLTGSTDGTARLWDPRTQPQLEVVVRTRVPVAEADYLPSGQSIVVAAGNRLRWHTANGRLLRSIGFRGPVKAVASSADGRTVAAAAGAGVTVIRRGGSQREIGLPGAAAVAVSSDGSAIAGGGRDGIARIWSADGRPLRALRGHTAPITDMAFSPDGLRIATSSKDKSARIWDTKTGTLLRVLKGHRDGVTSVSYSPDGRLLVTASRDHDGRLWNAETGALMQVLRKHSGSVADASFSPDGRWIVTAGPATVLLWKPGVREPILPWGFGGHKPLLTSAVFDPASRFVLSASTDGTVRRAECVVCGDLDSMLALAKTQLMLSGRTLTADERERYGIGG